MKILRDGCVYVQKNDLVSILHSEMPVPVSVVSVITLSGSFYVNDNNKFEFVKFDSDEDVEYFSNLDCLIDYDEYSNMTVTELEQIYGNVCAMQNDLYEKYDDSDIEYQQKNYKRVLEEYDGMDIKMGCIRDLIWFKQGHISFSFPSELGIKQENRFVKRLKTLFDKNN